MNFHSHYTQMWVNRKSKRAYKSGRVLKWMHYYKSSFMRWLPVVRKLPGISMDDPVPTVVNYVFTVEEK